MIILKLLRLTGLKFVGYEPWMLGLQIS